VYDGDITAMTFKHIKSNRAFDNNRMFMDDDFEWLDTAESSLN
jgi:hypothetical protein